MKLIQENIKSIDFNDIVYLKEAYVGELRCVVAGLKNGRKLPLTMLESRDDCKSPITELNEQLDCELLKDFHVGDAGFFAVRKGEVNTLYVIESKEKGVVKVGAKFASQFLRNGILLTYQPPTARLYKIQSEIRAEYLARKEAEQDENNGSSLL